MSTGTRPITVAILAMGGQGGGVLSDWIVDLAEHNGYLAQATSVPGVAQRTGATIYYLEMFPEADAKQRGREPVLALMPMEGDVDVVIAAELMEAGRAISRGMVTGDRTSLIASTHRDYAIGEKMALGDGLLDHTRVIEAGEEAARHFVYFDMAALAEKEGSVISSVLFGALAGAKALPFPRKAYEDAIRRGGIGVEASLKAFSASYDKASKGSEQPVSGKGEVSHYVPPQGDAVQKHHPAVAALLDRVGSLPSSVQDLAVEGVRRQIDYQDPEYAGLYLDRLESVSQLDRKHGGEAHDYELSRETARYLALWMAYEDTIRVADLKTRSTRFQRFRDEVQAKDDQVVHVTEFMHPRVEEICDTLPAGLGQWILDTGWIRRLIGRFTTKGRLMRTSTALGFSILFVTARLRRWRRGTLRYRAEQARIDEWLAHVHDLVPVDYSLALEVVRCQRLVKGYGDTFERGLRSLQLIQAELEHIKQLDQPAAIVDRLREAALADENGDKLRNELEKLGQDSPVRPGAASPSDLAHA